MAYDVTPADSTTARGIQLASRILKQRGEIGLNEIRRMPFLTNANQVDEVVATLLAQMNAELYTKKVTSWPMLRWEQFIRIRNQMKPPTDERPA